MNAKRLETTPTEKPKGVPIGELPEALRAALGVEQPKPKRERFTAEDERRHAIRVLNTIHTLSQSARARVLRRALSMNNK